MNCFECTTQLQQATPAVATCSQCGAATCADHTRDGHAYSETHSPGTSSLYEMPGRRLYCTTCSPESPTSATHAAGLRSGVAVPPS